jgi:hypothetical protein
MEMIEKVQKIDFSNTALSSKTFRDEKGLVKEMMEIDRERKNK